MATIELPILEWQVRFIEDPSDVRAIIGGTRSGKSFICADELIERAMQYPRARHYIIGASHPTMKEGTIPTFMSRVREYGFDCEVNQQDLSVTITSGPAAGCRIIAWTVANGRFRNLKGQQIDSAWLDECQVWDHGADAYDFIEGRMSPSEEAQRWYPDLQPRIWLSANPPHTTSHWLYRYFVVEKKAPLYHATVLENYLYPERAKYIERLRRNYSSALFKIEVLGEFGDIGVGRAYDSFIRQANVAESAAGLPVAYDRELPLLWTHDFGVVPRVSVLSQRRKIDAPGFQPEVLFIFDEITLPEGNTSEQIAEFVNRYPRQIVRELVLYGDPAGQTRNSTNGDTDWTMLAWDERITPYAAKIDRASSAPLVVDRVNTMNSKIANANGDVGVVMHPRCVDTIQDFQTTKFKDGTRILDHGSAAKGLRRTHWSDAVSYQVVQIWPLEPQREIWAFYS